MRCATDRGQERAASLGRRVDVEEHELIRTLGRVPGGQLGRVALVEQVDEAGALHDPPAGHVETGDDPSQQHHAATGVESGAPTATAPDPRDASPTKSARSRRPSVPDRSGWNWVPSSRPLATMLANRPPWVVSATTTSGDAGRPANECTK